MAPKLITMLTYNDETVDDALSIFRECASLVCDFWGFKDVGLPEDRMKELVTAMKQAGKTMFLEVVSLTEEECLRGARIAVECGFDYLMGTVFFQSVFDYLKSHAKLYLPFCGKVTGHPSVVVGTIEDAIEEGKRLQKLEVTGFDLLLSILSSEKGRGVRRVALRRSPQGRTPPSFCSSVYFVEDVFYEVDAYRKSCAGISSMIESCSPTSVVVAGRL